MMNLMQDAQGRYLVINLTRKYFEHSTKIVAEDEKIENKANAKYVSLLHEI